MQKEKTIFYKSSLAASALFVVGNAIIVLPANSGEKYTIAGLALAAVSGVLLNLILLPLSVLILKSESKDSTILKVLKGVISPVLAVSALFFAADAFKDFVFFVHRLILPEVSLFVISLSFGLILAFFFFKRQEDTLKFSFLCFVFTAFSVLFFFFAMSDNFDIQNIKVDSLPDFKELKDSFSPYFFKAVLPSVLLPFYHTSVFGKRAGSAVITGTAAGYIILCLCILPAVLLFSAPLAGKLSYPYASAVSTVTVGKIFTRLDGFSYFLYFSAALSKINICLFIAKSLLKKLSKMA